ncbi:MAG TPA: 50S ribosomal protein L25/general stress protein Ctc [Firmicutes bacterium]|nr:50S ribosomal protein L25/general stress protein Ctc [Bacillota bacterium]
MATVELKVKMRNEVGKGRAKKLRAAGLIPAILYGEGEESRPLVVSYKDFHPVLHTAARENVILDLKIEGAEQEDIKAIIREIQYHPVKRDILHVDFQHISMTKEITVNVPIEVVGEPVGVKTKGGILETILREVEVECLPANIPDKIVVDVSELDVGDSLQVSDLRIENARIIEDPESTVVTVVAPTVVEEKPVEVEAEAEVEEEKPAEAAEKPAEAEAPETESEK